MGQGVTAREQKERQADRQRSKQAGRQAGRGVSGGDRDSSALRACLVCSRAEIVCRPASPHEMDKHNTLWHMHAKTLYKHALVDGHQLPQIVL